MPDTLAALLAAEVKVWVITGDKPETAINVGYSSQLLQRDMKLLRVPVDVPEDEVRYKYNTIL